MAGSSFAVCRWGPGRCPALLVYGERGASDPKPMVRMAASGIITEPAVRSSRIGSIAAVGLALALAIGSAGPALAQGSRTGLLTGQVRDAQGLAAPGATVRAMSPALQGVRSTATDRHGFYVLRGLPPGEYTVRFELTGMKPVEERTTIKLGRETALNVRLAGAGLAQEVTVVAETPPIVQTTAGGENYTHREINLLPVGRTPAAIASVAPGLTTNTPNAGQVTISGSFAYDNVFLIDGVDTGDNLLGTSHPLFIEDAIAETQVLTSGVPAEYGRFQGGVINAITQSGGNTFAGTFRVNLTNPAWTEQTPFERDNRIVLKSKYNAVYEGTLGGPIRKDRLWFFGAGRFANVSTSETLPQSGIGYKRAETNTRAEIKLTSTLRMAHTVTGSFLNNTTEQTQPAFSFTIDPAAIVTRTLPNHRFVVSYRGILKPNLFAEGQYSRKTFGFRNAGGTSPAANDSPVITLTQQLGHYNAPYFDAGDPENRNNRQAAGSLSWFVVPRRFGSHDLKGGLEVFRSQRTGGNSQSATGFVFEADYLTDGAGRPVLDASGRFIPVFVFGETLIEVWMPEKGAELDLTTTSLYVQDRWAAGRRLTLDLGLRAEFVRGEATGDLVAADTRTVVPRLAAAFDLTGSGRYVLQGTYAHYSGKYSEAQFGQNTTVGNPNALFGVYVGPNGQGRGFTPGFTRANYVMIDGFFPTANVQFVPGLSSPTTRELTGSLGTVLSRGYLKAQYVWRDMENFFEDFITREGGVTEVVREGLNLGRFQNRVYRNSDVPERRYQGFILQGRYDVTRAWQAHAHWTLQLENDGNFEGEAPNQPGITSVIGDYPEAFTPARHYPDGRLDDFQRHRLRAWTILTLGLGRFGAADLGALYRYDSPRTFSFASPNVPLTPVQRARLAGYATIPVSQTLFFEGRGTGEYNGSHLVDVAATYSIPVFRSAHPWLKVEITNLLNAHPLISFDTTVIPDPASPADSLGLRTGYVKTSRFGQATRKEDFPQPRTYRVFIGVRF